jgi:eukaryotic-like serine/threonine-protein kinase
MLGSIAHYNLLERIGEGVLGDVYRARDTKVGRTVALKLQREPLPAGRRHERLVDDARAAAKISHPNIATLFDVGYYEGRLYLAYEFVKGSTLRQQMEGRPMNSRHALDLAAQVADALAHAHANGVIHKDLSPDTIVETTKGSAKVLDFGMSAWTRGGQTRALAAAAPHSVGADAVGVLSYVSPEQARGVGVDGRTDLFSLGAIVYEMLTGMNPFAGPDALTTLANITDRTPQAPTALNPELPKLLDIVLLRALASDPTRRTESASKLAADLRRCAGLVDSVATERPSREPRRPTTSDDPDLIPLEEEKGGVWWVFVGLGGALAAALYFWLR